METLPHDILRKIYELLPFAYRAAFILALPTLDSVIKRKVSFYDILRRRCGNTMMKLILHYRAMVTGPILHECLFEPVGSRPADFADMDILFSASNAIIHVNDRKNTAVLTSVDARTTQRIRQYEAFHKYVSMYGFVSWDKRVASDGTNAFITTKLVMVNAGLCFNLTFTNVAAAEHIKNYWHRPYRLIYTGRLTVYTRLAELLHLRQDFCAPTARFHNQAMRVYTVTQVMIPTFLA